jgi:hypothetical protein
VSGEPGLFRRAWSMLVAGDDEAPPAPDPDPVPADSFPIAQARARSRVDCQGRISQASVVEHDYGPWFEAELDDGTGSVTLVWMGRAAVPGVTEGRRLRVKGRLAPDRGRLVVFNPDYALDPV